MSSKSFIIIIITVAGLVLIGFGASRWYLEETKLRPVTISSVEGATEGFLTDVIKAYGIDKKNGLDITVKKAPVKEAEKMVKDREVDAGVYNPVAAAKDNLKGIKLRVFGPFRWNVTSVIAKANSPFNAVSDLRGKRIGFAGDKNSSNYINCRITFSILGSDLEKDFKAVFSDKESTSIERLKNGELEAIVISEPHVSRILGTEEFKEIEKLRFIWQEKYGLPLPCNSLTAYDDWLRSNKTIAQKLNKTFTDAAKFIISEPRVFEEQREALKALGLEKETAIKTFRSNVPTIYQVRWGEDIISDLEKLLAVSVNFGVLERLPAEQIIIDPFKDL